VVEAKKAKQNVISVFIINLFVNSKVSNYSLQN
jgi:hypothetical protein